MEEVGGRGRGRRRGTVYWRGGRRGEVNESGRERRDRMFNNNHNIRKLEA